MRSLARVVQGLGVLGLLACIGFAIVGLPAASRVDAILGTSDATLGTAASAARRAADAFDGFDASLGEATVAAGEAAALAERSAQTARDLSAAMSINIFGTQPLQQLAGGFDASASDLDGLGGTLRTMGDALQGNGDDLAALQTQLTRLADQLEQLSAPRRLPSILPATVGLLVLLALQSLGVLAAGLALSRLDARFVAVEAGR